MDPFGGFNFMFGIFPIIFFVMFALVIGVFIYVLTKNASREHKNNNSPTITPEYPQILLGVLNNNQSII